MKNDNKRVVRVNCHLGKKKGMADKFIGSGRIAPKEKLSLKRQIGYALVKAFHLLLHSFICWS